MSSQRQQVTNSAVYLLPVVVGNLVPIITLPIFTRLLSTEDFGAWALANAYAVVVGALAVVGLPFAQERNFFEFRESRQRAHLLYSVIAFSVTSYALVGLVTWGLLEQITTWLIGPARYQPVLMWSFAATTVAGLKGYYMTYLKNMEEAKAFAAYAIAERLLSAVLTLALVAGLGIGVLGLVIGQMMASLIVLGIVAVRFLREYPVGVDGGLLVDALKLGFPLVPRTLFGVIGNNVDKYLIGQVASLGGVGVYTVAQRIANIAFTYMTALQNVFGPQVYARMFSGDPEAGLTIGRYLTPFAYAATAVSFLIALFSEEIIFLIAPPAYQGAIPIVAILVLFYAIQFFGKMPQLAYARQTKLISVLAAVSTAVSITTGAIGIWWLGTVGAAWGALVAGAIMITLTFVFGQRAFRIDWESRKLVAIFGLLFTSAFLLIALRAVHTPYPLLLLVKLSCTGAFLWLGVRFRWLTLENMRFVRDLVWMRGRPSV